MRSVFFECLSLQIIIEAIAAFLEAVVFVERMGVCARQAAVENDALAAASAGERAGVVHERTAVAFAALTLVDDEARKIAGLAAEPEGVKKCAVTKSQHAVVVCEEKCEAVLVSENLCVNAADFVAVVGVVGPELFDKIKGDVKIVHRGVSECHCAPPQSCGSWRRL